MRPPLRDLALLVGVHAKELPRAAIDVNIMKRLLVERIPLVLRPVAPILNGSEERVELVEDVRQGTGIETFTPLNVTLESKE